MVLMSPQTLFLLQVLGTPLKWSKVRGPLGAMRLVLHRLGCHAFEPFTWIDDLGVERSFFEHTPSATNEFLRAAVQRSHERAVRGKFTDETLSGDRRLV